MKTTSKKPAQALVERVTDAPKGAEAAKVEAYARDGGGHVHAVFRRGGDVALASRGVERVDEVDVVAGLRVLKYGTPLAEAGKDKVVPAHVRDQVSFRDHVRDGAYLPFDKAETPVLAVFI